MQRPGDYLYTHSGRQFWPLDPQADEIDIEDIAHGLSHTCRFAGQVPYFYSVAEHSVHVSVLCEKANAATLIGLALLTLPLYGLLHDASEAYLCDIPHPLKIQPQMAGYREVEACVQAAIYRRFGLSPAEPHQLKTYDDVMLGVEQRDLFPDRSARTRVYGIGPLIEKADISVTDPLGPQGARQLFLNRYGYLMNAIRRAGA